MKSRKSISIAGVWSLRILVAAASIATAMAQPLCVGPAYGVPGATYLQPPDWVDPSPPQPSFNNRTDDPRWSGATRVDYNSSEANFRILEGLTDGNVYLSWNVNLTNGAENHVFFGWNSPTGPNLVDILVQGGPPLTDAVIGGGTQTSVQAYSLSAAGVRGATIALPAFMASARVWRNAPSWTVQLALPKSQLKLNGDGTYSLFINMVPGDPTNIAIVTYPWPKTVALPAYPDVPPIAMWGEFKSVPSTADPSCAGNAVSLTSIGVRGTGLTIVRSGPNVLFAKAANNTGAVIPMNTLQARFRIANWGSTTLWADLPGGTMVGNAMDIPSTGAPDSDAQDNHFTWDPGGAPGLSQHQCILVELSSTTGLQFAVASFYQNMNFDTASVLEREAEISIKGLTPIAPDGRDVYIWIETRNMPSSGASPLPGTIRTIVPPTEARVVDLPGGYLRRDVAGGRITLPGVPTDGPPAPFSTPADLQALYDQGRITQDIVEEVIPTYRIHVFYDSGQKWTINGAQKAILTPQSSFGYYAVHTGAIYGWETTLVPQGFTLEKLADNFYRISKVPNDGVIKLVARVTALETKPNAFWPFPWWVWLLIAIIVIVVIVKIVTK